MMINKSIADTTTFYVASDGNDAWSGKLDAPNQDKTDGPFATLQHARDAIREIKQKQGGILKQPINVFVRGGNYFLNEPLTFTPEDSGTADCPVTFIAYKDEKPVISGGRLITVWKQINLPEGRTPGGHPSGWEQTDVNGKKLWVAEIPEVREGKWFFRQLWVNGQRRKRSRYPNKGYLAVAEIPGLTTQTQWTEGQTSFKFFPGDLNKIKNTTDTEIILMTKWVESHLPIISIDTKNNIVSFSKRSVFLPEVGDLYYLEHSLDTLDSPGEWYLDRKNGTLYYYPMPDEDMDNAEVIAPVLTQLIQFQGKPEASQFIKYINFKNLTFAHTEWYFPEGFQATWPKPDVGGFPQAAFGVPAAIYGEGVHNCKFEGCTIAHIGNYAVELSRGCVNNQLLNYQIFDLGAGGVKIGEPTIRENEAEQTHDNEVSSCYIHDGGLIFHSAIGIWVGQSYNNLFSHNHIHDFYYSGFSIGWTWGYGSSLAKGNVVEYNHVHHIGIKSDGDGPILSDMGGIYTLGMQPGTVIKNNLFHDIAGLRYGGWGIYFDEGSTTILAENNIVYNTTHGGFHQHYGKENIVRNNIFAYGRDAQIQCSRLEPHLRFTFERNIVYWQEGKLFAGDISDYHFKFDKNLYWQKKKEDKIPEGLESEIDLGKMSWDEWQTAGMDKHSLIADPLFIDSKKGNFQLKRKSPAFKLGIEQIPVEKIGIIKLEK